MSPEAPFDTDPALLLTQIQERLQRLADLADPMAFDALLVISQEIGVHLGASARRLAAAGSWAQVASAAGTSRQAAWERWHGSLEQ